MNRRYKCFRPTRYDKDFLLADLVAEAKKKHIFYLIICAIIIMVTGVLLGIQYHVLLQTPKEYWWIFTWTGIGTTLIGTGFLMGGLSKLGEAEHRIKWCTELMEDNWF